jgi:hypothetical protein
MREGDWIDPDEILLLLELYIDVRDSGRDDRSSCRGLARDLRRDSNAVFQAMWAFARGDPKAPSRKRHYGLSQLAQAIWNRYADNSAEVRRLASEIRQHRGRDLRRAGPLLRF